MNRPIYLDHHSTTPVDPSVFEAMRPYFTEAFGNPSSREHGYGWEAAEAVEEARGAVARLLGAVSDEIVFTSGATEANALALRGALRHARLDHAGPSGAHLVTVATEHSSVLETVCELSAEGIDVTVLPVASDGTLDLAQLEAAIGDRTVLVSVMAANNEIGTLAPLVEIGRLTRARGVLFHTDASQAVGLMPVHVDLIGCDLLSLSAHKIYGPKGVGALFVRGRDRPVHLTPQQRGGGQERGLRSGTLNVPGIVGLGRACALAVTLRTTEGPRLARLRDRLLDRLLACLDGMHVNGTLRRRLPNNLNVSFEGVDGEALFAGLSELAVSSGSACRSARRQPSHVLKALGRPDALAQATIRFGLGSSTTEADIDRAIERVVATVRRLRGETVPAKVPVGS